MRTALAATRKAEKKKKGAPSAEPLALAESSSRPLKTASCGWPLFLTRALQRKLAVGSVDDPLEREADRVAEQVVSSDAGGSNVPATQAHPRRANGGIQRKCSCGTASSSGECEACREKSEEGIASTPMIRRSTGEGAENVSDAPSVVHQALRSPGRPLDASARRPLEARFGQDFADVRVHDDSRAAESAQAVNALAYTAGEDVVFAPGQYRPGSQAGRKLLAHELAHVVQQRSGGPSSLRRQPAPNLNISMNPAYAAALSNSELAQQILALQIRLSTLPANDAERIAINGNLEILQSEQAKRGTLGGAAARQSAKCHALPFLPSMAGTLLSRP